MTRHLISQLMVINYLAYFGISNLGMWLITILNVQFMADHCVVSILFVRICDASFCLWLAGDIGGLRLKLVPRHEVSSLEKLHLHIKICQMQKPDTARGRLWGGGLKGQRRPGTSDGPWSIFQPAMWFPSVVVVVVVIHRLYATICLSHTKRSSFTRRRHNV